MKKLIAVENVRDQRDAAADAWRSYVAVKLLDKVRSVIERERLDRDNNHFALVLHKKDVELLRDEMKTFTGPETAVLWDAGMFSWLRGEVIEFDSVLIGEGDAPRGIIRIVERP